MTEPLAPRSSCDHHHSSAFSSAVPAENTEGECLFCSFGYLSSRAVCLFCHPGRHQQLLLTSILIFILANRQRQHFQRQHFSPGDSCRVTGNDGLEHRRREHPGGEWGLQWCCDSSVKLLLLCLVCGLLKINAGRFIFGQIQLTVNMTVTNLLVAGELCLSPGGVEGEDSCQKAGGVDGQRHFFMRAHWESHF